MLVLVFCESGSDGFGIPTGSVKIALSNEEPRGGNVKIPYEIREPRRLEYVAGGIGGEGVEVSPVYVIAVGKCFGAANDLVGLEATQSLEKTEDDYLTVG